MNKNNKSGFVAITIVVVTSFSLLLTAVASMTAVGDYIDMMSRQEHREYTRRQESSCRTVALLHNTQNPWHPFVCEPISFFVENNF